MVCPKGNSNSTKKKDRNQVDKELRGGGRRKPHLVEKRGKGTVGTSKKRMKKKIKSKWKKKRWKESGDKLGNRRKPGQSVREIIPGDKRGREDETNL